MRFVPLLLLLCSACSLSAAAPGAPRYVRTEVMIPMRDGVRLHAIVLRPAKGAGHADESLPILLNRTPYGVAKTTPAEFVKRYPEFAAAGYIFAQEDIRGRFGSEGTFVMMRPLAAHHNARQYPHEVDESTDAWDTVAWLVAHVPQNSGRVGVLGVSYDGFLTTMAGIDPHPAVKAISPQAPMTDVWRGDDFFHNGAFRQTYGYDYAIGMESTKENGFGKLDRDAYDFFLSAGSFSGAARQSGVSAARGAILPSWQGFLDHPTDDGYWQQRSVLPHLDRAAVPTLEVGGWWDQEDMWGPQAQYAALKSHDSGHMVYIALGPWNHGEWRSEASSLGALDWDQATGATYRAQVEEPFFEHYLRPERGTSWTVQAAVSFQTGSNEWRHYDAWPPEKQTRMKALYLGPEQTLSFTQPVADAAAAEEATSYTSDPAHPVPYRARPIEATYAPTGSHWYTWLAEDQRPATARADVASWKSAPLDRSVTVTGEITADLFASTSGTDSDWVAKLIDVYPDDPAQGKMAGYQLMIAEEIFRGRYRASFTEPQAIPQGEPEEYRFSLHGADHVFLPGHRLMVQVQSSWFPLYDRNPQIFVPNIMQARPADYHAATQKIYWSAKYPSHLDVPVAASQ